VAGWNLYLLALLVVAARSHREDGKERSPADTPALVVLVPAHDEQAGIAATLRSLVTQSYPTGKFEVIVIADNCSDLTASVAEDVGVTVWPRTAPDARGKGRALTWALARLAQRSPPPRGVVVVDADCIASPNLLAAIGERIAAGCAAVQARYIVGNPAASTASALRFAGFSLVHDVRMAAKSHLDLSAGLMGTGMAFSWDTLARVPWDSLTITEDTEYHLKLVAAGMRVAYAPEASVSSDMPTSFTTGVDQQERWEAGKRQILTTVVPQLLRSSATRRDLATVNAVLELFVPPQAALFGANVFGAALAFAGGRGRARRAASAINLAAQGAYVLGGLAYVKAPARVYRSLASAPALALRKTAILVRLAVGHGPTTFVRTARGSDGTAGDDDTERHPASATPAKVQSSKFGIV
jgi:1,2-diacylglycerol 3-beta-glucosyltransferase